MESLQTDTRFEDNLKHSADEHNPEEGLARTPHSSSLMTPVKIKRRVIVQICLLELSQTMNDRGTRKSFVPFFCRCWFGLFLKIVSYPLDNAAGKKKSSCC